MVRPIEQAGPQGAERESDQESRALDLIVGRSLSQAVIQLVI